MKAPILVIEDDEKIRGNLSELLDELGFEVTSADNGVDGIALGKARVPALVLCDIMLPRADGYAVLDALRSHPQTSSVPFIFLTAKSDRADQRLGMNLGADDYLTKPFTLGEVTDAVKSRLQRHEALVARARDASEVEARESAVLAQPGFEPADGVVVVAPVMKALYEQVARVAVSPINVLVLGENGVGKELLARAIHNLSGRKNGPFVALNCAALSESLVLGELFGHEKGAFTGALQARAGLLESASGGTVFLDEIGELPLSMQAKLLRALEERKVMRLGARVEREIDVRFVAATNRDLEQEAEQGAFRQDLYFRLNGISLTVPPLRARREEIRQLARMFLARARATQSAEPLELSEAALAVLERYHFPGNVRELKNIIDRGAVLCSGRVLLPEHLPEKLTQNVGRPSSEPPRISSSPPSPRREGESRADRAQILEALERCAGNQTRAAEFLGISRRTLVSRLSEFEIPRPRKR
jgi:two-component system, NtrC family, response regulator AtoC